MKNSHLTTPRTLSDCTFDVGHVEATSVSRALGYFLAFVSGAVMSYLLILWSSI
jgi:hypothetical protein